MHQLSRQEILAFDRSTARSISKDGFLHVARSNISKATVNPYRGNEIPDWEKLGLIPDKIYQLFRDPKELAAGAATFNNVPLLMRHVPVNSDDHRPDLTVGSTGTDAEFDGTYLVNSLVVWPQDAIDLIESGQQKELSCAYRYRADMTPGNFEGQPYDGVMRDIVGNHVALVTEGRAGSDVVVGDSKPEEFKMQKTVLSRKAAVARGAIMAFLQPKLAADAKIDLTPILAKVTAKNFKASCPAIITGVTKATTGKLAQDASLDTLQDLLAAFEDDEVAEDAEESEEDKKKKEAAAANDADPDKFLASKMSAEDKAAYDKMCADKAAKDKAAQDAAEEEEKKKAQDAENEAKEPSVKKPAMDAAIKVAVDAAKKEATAAAIKLANDIRDAEKAVRPYVGDLAMACDSAEGVYRTALGAMDAQVEGLADLPLNALKAILAAQPLPGSKRQEKSTFAQDAKAAGDYGKAFPGADKISFG